MYNTKECPVCHCNFRPTEKNPDKCDLCTREGREPPQPKKDILVESLSEKKIQRLIDEAIGRHIKQDHEVEKKITYKKKCVKCGEDFEAKSTATKYCDICKK